MFYNYLSNFLPFLFLSTKKNNSYAIILHTLLLSLHYRKKTKTTDIWQVMFINSMYGYLI